jgi:hypothetical protein
MSKEYSRVGRFLDELKSLEPSSTWRALSLREGTLVFEFAALQTRNNRVKNEDSLSPDPPFHR